MGIFSSKTKLNKKDSEAKAEAKTVTKKAVKKTNTKATAKTDSKEVAVSSTVSNSVQVPFSATEVIIRPRITEKASAMTESHNAFTFEVTKGATKPLIASAVKTMYKVSPVKVRIVNLPAKQVFVRGKKGSESAVKKAIVYLKKGETIQLA